MLGSVGGGLLAGKILSRNLASLLALAHVLASEAKLLAVGTRVLAVTLCAELVALVAGAADASADGPRGGGPSLVGEAAVAPQRRLAGPLHGLVMLQDVVGRHGPIMTAGKGGRQAAGSSLGILKQTARDHCGMTRWGGRKT